MALLLSDVECSGSNDEDHFGILIGGNREQGLVKHGDPVTDRESKPVYLDGASCGREIAA
jgi:hypothetical protein